VIENYLHTMEPPDPVMNMKSVVDPTRVAAYASAHHAIYPYMSAVDENGFPVDDHTLATPSYERLRVNHYHLKSEEELLAKFERWRAMGTRPSASFQRFLAWGDETPGEAELEAMRREEANGATDETILQFAPALREALEGVKR
jgi:hypothetical protein